MLPDSWVDTLFARLTARYGVAFQRQYADIDPAVVKADWARALDGLPGDAIKRALDRLPADRPPNAGQFRRLCVDAIPGEAYRVYKALPAPTPVAPEAARRRLAEIRRRATGYATRQEQEAALSTAEEQALQQEPLTQEASHAA